MRTKLCIITVLFIVATATGCGVAAGATRRVGGYFENDTVFAVERRAEHIKITVFNFTITL